MQNGTVIILNGTSSSGKTAIIWALQDLLDEPALEAGLDKFLWMLPRRYLNQPLWNDVLGRATEAGPIGHKLVSGMHRAVATLARTGSHVLVDHVLVEPAWVHDCARVFGDLPAYLVAVRCPLAVLEQRERERRDRTLGQARAQFDLVHAHAIYDLEVDTSLLDPVGCALRIKTHLESGKPPQALRSIAGLPATPTGTLTP